MRAWKHPATIIATLALFVALGGGTALASGLIPGTRIVNHSIPEKKLTAGTIEALSGASGPSNAYTASTGNTLTTVDDTKWVKLGSLKLAAGAYVVIGKAELGPSQYPQYPPWCSLDYKEETASIDFTASAPSTVTLFGPLQTGTGTTVELKCRAVYGSTSAANSDIVAIKVASVTGSQ